MTSRAAPSYGATYLTPLALLDWSSRWALLRWDVSTLSMSSRDWIDVWVTPIRDALTVPIEHNGVAFQGTPKNAIHIRNANDASGWTVDVIKKFRTVKSRTLKLPGNFPHSAMVRTPVRVKVFRNRVVLSMDGVGRVVVNAGPNFRRGMVQFAEHAYNPFKDNAGVAATWHWDNFTLAPASKLPIRRVTPQRRTADRPGAVRKFTFSGPAPARSVLLFDAVCQVSVNFGSGFRRVAKQPSSGHNGAAESPSSYKVAVPRGARKVVVRFRPDGWYSGFPCMVENPIVVKNARNPGPVPASWG
jgi:hypothetical protein